MGLTPSTLDATASCLKGQRVASGLPSRSDCQNGESEPCLARTKTCSSECPVQSFVNCLEARIGGGSVVHLQKCQFWLASIGICGRLLAQRAVPQAPQSLGCCLTPTPSFRYRKWPKSNAALCESIKSSNSTTHTSSDI